MRDRVQCQSAGKWQPGDLTRSDWSSVGSDTGTGVHCDCIYLAESRGRTIADNYGESLGFLSVLSQATEEEERRMMPGYQFTKQNQKTVSGVTLDEMLELTKCCLVCDTYKVLRSVPD